MDDIEYWQHKYYRGYILPMIALAQGELDIEYVHQELKDKFIKYQYIDLRDIPSRHRSRCRIIQIDRVTIDGEVKSEKYYVPSMATLNEQEAREYILKTEGLRDGFIDWSIGEDKEKIKAMMEARRLAGL
jgi:hypothetical protein